MKVVQAIFDQAGHLISPSSQLWVDAKYFVQDVDGKTGLTGQQKKEKVKADLLAIFGDTFEFLFNVIIELAVSYLRAKVS